jgi:hypothetical protein
MIRFLSLLMLCTSAVATGVVVASPSLASVFESHHAPIHHSASLWDWSVVSAPPRRKAAVRLAAEHVRPPARPHRHAATAPAPAPAPATTSPTPPPPAAATGSGSPDPTSAQPAAPAYTLRSVDARCFFAPTAPGGWPFAPTTAVHPVRGSFDEPRSPVHIGVDVEAPRDKAPVYAMQAGTVQDVQPDHFDVAATDGPHGAYLQYWHVSLDPGIKAGTVVHRRERLGHVKAGMLHVHISEYVPGCGLVDPARPTGLLHDPYDTEWPAIGPLTAYAAGARAFVPVAITVPPGTGEVADPAQRMPLGELHGTVDLRAAVTDTPRLKMQHNPQLPLAPAAIRAFLTPAANGRRHLVTHPIFDGSRLLPTGAKLWRYWAFGTYRQNGCYFDSSQPCGMQIVWHVGGPQGFDTRSVPNGSYRYCVEALTIAGVDGRRCTRVTIAN